MNRRLRAGAILVATVLSWLTITPAAIAESKLDISNPTAVVGRIAPKLVQNSAENGKDRTSEVAVGTSDSGVAFTPENPSEGREITISPVPTTAAGQEKPAQSGQFHVVRDGDRAIYVQGHGAGARFLSAIDDRAKKLVQAYDLILEDGTVPIALMQADGGIKFVDSLGGSCWSRFASLGL